MVIKYRELRKRSKGFTLIELMIVVAIIAILAAIAIPQYKKFQLKSKTSEAKTNLGAIKTCEEAYAAEHDVYLSANWTPTTAIGTSKRAWEVNPGFNSIGFRPAGMVYYNYGVGIGTAAPSALTNNNVTDGTVDITMWAKGDLDGDGSKSNYWMNDENTMIGHNGDDF